MLYFYFYGNSFVSNLIKYKLWKLKYNFKLDVLFLIYVCIFNVFIYFKYKFVFRYIYFSKIILFKFLKSNSFKNKGVVLGFFKFVIFYMIVY